MAFQRMRIGAVCLAFSLGTIGITTVTPGTAADEAYSIEEIMEYNHSGKKSLTNKVTLAVKAGKWDEAAPAAAKMKTLGAALGKNPCPGGDAASWKKLTALYAEHTARIASAVEKKDAKEANAALGILKKSCKTCHDAHR